MSISRSLLGLTAALCLVGSLPTGGQVKPRPRSNPPRTTAKPPERTAPGAKYRPDDAMATVEGQVITRRELVNHWLQLDPRTQELLGSLLSSRWQAANGASPSYTLTEADIYQQLFSDPNNYFVNMLSNMITTRLVAIEAARKGIIVTRTEAQAYAHELLDQLRRQRGLQLKDDQMIEALRLPRDVFMEDMTFKVQAERLFAAEISRRNGHALNPDDWIVVRQLFAAAQLGSERPDIEAQFAAARKRVEASRKEIEEGRNMAEVARDHNEDASRPFDGLRPPILRGTGPKPMEYVVWQLKPGELSTPLRGNAGWHIFRVEQRGTQIPEETRKAAWKDFVEKRLPEFLSDLRKKAKITSIVPLPVNLPPPGSVPSLQGSLDTPPPPPTAPRF